MQLTSNQYSTLSSLMATSKTLITTLERSNVLDRLVLFGAFAFFAAVCAHIFKKRVVDRGVHVAGALGGLVTKGGSAFAGIARRGQSADEVAAETAEVVKRGVADEWAKATAAATGAAGAIRAGIDMARSKATQAVTDRNVPTQTPSRFEDSVHASAAEDSPVFEQVLPPQDEPTVAPVEPDVHEEAETVLDAADEPVHVVEADMSLDEPIPGAAPTEETFEPVVMEPLDDYVDFPDGEADAQLDAAGERAVPPATASIEDAKTVPFVPVGDSDSLETEPEDLEAASAYPTKDSPPTFVDLPLADDVETLAPRQRHPPTPSLPDLPDLAFETPAKEEMPPQKPDLEEVVEAEHRDLLTAEDGDEPVDGNVGSEGPETDSAEDPEAPEEEVAPTEDAEEEVQVDGDDEVGVQVEHEHVEADEGDATLDDLPAEAIIDLSADEAASASASGDQHLSDPIPTAASAGEDHEEVLSPIDVVEAAAGEAIPRDTAGVEGTTQPLDVLDEEDAPPPLDVEGTEENDASAPPPADERQAELPIDLEAEQTIWTEEARAIPSNDDVQESVAATETDGVAYEPEEQADESLLEELLDQQMGPYAGAMPMRPHVHEQDPLDAPGEPLEVEDVRQDGVAFSAGPADAEPSAVPAVSNAELGDEETGIDNDAILETTAPAEAVVGVADAEDDDAPRAEAPASFTASSAPETVPTHAPRKSSPDPVSATVPPTEVDEVEKEEDEEEVSVEPEEVFPETASADPPRESTRSPSSATASAPLHPSDEHSDEAAQPPADTATSSVPDPAEPYEPAAESTTADRLPAPGSDIDEEEELDADEEAGLEEDVLQQVPPAASTPLPVPDNSGTEVVGEPAELASGAVSDPANDETIVDDDRNIDGRHLPTVPPTSAEATATADVTNLVEPVVSEVHLDEDEVGPFEAEGLEGLPDTPVVDDGRGANGESTTPSADLQGDAESLTDVAQATESEDDDDADAPVLEHDEL